MTITTAKPFLFDTSFDEEELRRQAEARQQAEEEERLAALRAEEEANPPPPTFTEEELKAAQATAWQEGHEAGIRDAHAEREAAVTALLEALSAEVGGMHVHQDLSNERIGLHLTKVAVQVLRKVLPEFTAKHGADEVKAVLGDCFERIPFDSKLIVTVAPETEELLTPSIEALAARSGFEGRTRIVSDPDMGPSDLTAIWDGGGLDRLEEAIWQEIEQRIERVQPPAPAQQPPPAQEAAAETDPEETVNV